MGWNLWNWAIINSSSLLFRSITAVSKHVLLSWLWWTKAEMNTIIYMPFLEIGFIFFKHTTSNGSCYGFIFIYFLFTISGTSMLFLWLVFDSLHSPKLYIIVIISQNLPKLFKVYIFVNSHSSRCEMISSCGFHLHFYDVSSWWASFLCLSAIGGSPFKKCLRGGRVWWWAPFILELGRWGRQISTVCQVYLGSSRPATNCIGKSCF